MISVIFLLFFFHWQIGLSDNSSFLFIFFFFAEAISKVGAVVFSLYED